MTRAHRHRRLHFETLEARRVLSFNPTGIEQEIFQYVNRMRTNPQAELSLLVDNLDPISSPDSDVSFALQFFDVDGHVLARQWESLQPVPPLAWNAALYEAAGKHNDVMIAHGRQEHQLPGEPDIGTRLRQAGYNYNSWGENIFAYCESPLYCHAGFAIDWGFTETGIQEPPGHRENLMSAGFREIGLAVHVPAAGDLGPLVITQDFGNRRDIGQPFLVGAVFEDRYDTGHYRDGAGLGAVDLEFSGPAGTFTTTTMSAGGYQLQVPAGTYTATASGGTLREPLVIDDIVVGAANVAVDLIVAPPPTDRFEPNDYFESARSLESVDQVLSDLTLHIAGDADVFRWLAPDHGDLQVKLSFEHDRGDLLLAVYDEQRRLIAESDTTADEEVVSISVSRGTEYYLVVRAAEGDWGPDYSLAIDGPLDGPDAWEPNDSFAAAAPLPVGDQVLEQLSLHHTGDQDYYHWTSLAPGRHDVALDFDHSVANLDLFVYDDQERLLASSETENDTEHVSLTLTGGQSIFILAKASDDSPLASYRLRLDGIMPPQGRGDVIATNLTAAVTIPVLTNDRDSDGELDPESLSIVQLPAAGSATVSAATGQLQYTADSGFSGLDTLQYQIADNDGAMSEPVTVIIAVLDYARHPWTNPVNHLDVNLDDKATPLDALVLINELNANSPYELPAPSETQLPLPFLDPNRDGWITPLDVLLLVNFLNRDGAEGEFAALLPWGPGGSPPSAARETAAVDIPTTNDTPHAAVQPWSPHFQTGAPPRHRKLA